MMTIMVRVRFINARMAIEVEEVLQILLAAGCINSVERTDNEVVVSFRTTNASRTVRACSTFGATVLSVVDDNA